MAKLMATTYDELFPILSEAHNNYRVIGNNTSAKLENGVITITLHGSDIVMLHRNGDILFSLAGFNSLTTRERINHFIPGRVHNVDDEPCYDFRPIRSNTWYNVKEFE